MKQIKYIIILILVLQIFSFLEDSWAASPIGWLDSADSSHVTGWAYDADLKKSSVTIKVDIDSATAKAIIITATANLIRRDLVTAGVAQDPNHGFDVILPILPLGNHSIRIYAVDYPSGSLTELSGSPKTITVSGPASGTISCANCTIPAGATTCQTFIIWSTQNVQGAYLHNASIPGQPGVISTALKGVKTVSVDSRGTTFNLYQSVTNKLLASVFFKGIPATYSFVPANFYWIIASTTGVFVNASYPSSSSPPTAAKIDLYVKQNGYWELNNRCYLNSAADKQAPGQSFCPYQFPLVQGSTQDILVRIWRVTSDYANYADESGLEYDDYTTNLPLREDDSYTAAMQSRLVTIDRPSYRAKIDPHGGATYEFYNKRARSSFLSDGEFVNSIHTNLGAALQVALHNGSQYSLTKKPCAGQGYENPTQAGARCTYLNENPGTGSGPAVSPDPADPQSGLTVICNDCSSTVKKLELSLHRMMNWDYGPGDPESGDPGYVGPYNPADLTKLAQTTIAYDNFLEYNLQLRNAGQKKTFAAEVPTYYFTNQFRRFYYPSKDGIVSEDIPINKSGIESGINAKNFNKTIEVTATDGSAWTDNEPRWITFENTSGLVNIDNYCVTLAWFYAPETQQAINLAESGQYKRGLFLLETNTYHTIKFSNGPMMTMQPGTTYNLKYVLFPYRYDDVITTKYGTKSVAETIKLMQDEFESLPLR